jgi:integrase
MLTGQRVEVIARLHVDQWDAAELIESIKPNEYGWFFPSATDPSKPVSHGTLYSFLWRKRNRERISVVTNRDLRRTWKTLAGKAGLSKEIRDRLQNHTLQDVSSKSYDRWNYMPEKRAAMTRWVKFVRGLLAKQKHQAAFKEAA